MSKLLSRLDKLDKLTGETKASKAYKGWWEKWQAAKAEGKILTKTGEQVTEEEWVESQPEPLRSQIIWARDHPLTNDSNVPGLPPL
jgi:hypothetical protein